MESSASGHADHRTAHALHLPQVVWFVWVVREESLLEYYMPKLIEANQEPGFNIRIYQTGKPKDKPAAPAADGDAKAEAEPQPEPQPEPEPDDAAGRRQYRVSNLPSGVRTLGYRNSADIDDRCGNDIFAAAGSTHAAMDETLAMEQATLDSAAKRAPWMAATPPPPASANMPYGPPWIVTRSGTNASQSASQSTTPPPSSVSSEPLPLTSAQPPGASTARPLRRLISVRCTCAELRTSMQRERCAPSSTAPGPELVR